MLTKIKEFFSSIKELFSPTVVVVVVIDLAMIVFGHLLGLAAIAGIAATISVAFVLMGLKSTIKPTAIGGISKWGGWIDGILTAILTVYGFSSSVTLGLTAMMIGLNLSAFVSICRWLDNRYKKTDKVVTPHIVDGGLATA